jgi:sugar-specific transcriptional regulator TrmB
LAERVEVAPFLASAMDRAYLLSVLEELGLSPNEAKVYFASLQSGPASVTEVARASGVKRTTVYSVLTSLAEKGLVAKEVHKFRQRFVPREPNELLHLLEIQRKKLDQALPHFNAINQLGSSQSVLKHYHGMASLRRVYLEMLELVRPGEDYMVLGNQEQWLPLSSEFFTSFIKIRAELQIRVRVILTESAEARDYMKGNKARNEEIRLLPPTSRITTNLVVIPRRVLIHQLVEPVSGLVIENPHVVTMHQEMFEQVWNGLA